MPITTLVKFKRSKDILDKCIHIIQRNIQTNAIEHYKSKPHLWCANQTYYSRVLMVVKSSLINLKHLNTIHIQYNYLQLVMDVKDTIPIPSQMQFYVTMIYTAEAIVYNF